MKKLLYVLYFALLAAIVFVDVCFLLALVSMSFGIFAVAVSVITLGLVAWRTAVYFKTYDPAKKRANLILLPILLAIPTAFTIVVYIGIAVALIFAFA